MEGDYAEVDGAQVYYISQGQGEPLILLHGGLGSSEDFAAQIPAFSEHFRVIAFDRSGHGRTRDSSSAFTFESMVKQTASFIEALRFERVDVVGWSDGAIVSLLLAISRPDLVGKVVSVGGLADADAQTKESRSWIESATPESFPRSIVDRYGKASPDGPNHFAVVLGKTKKLWLTEPHIRAEEMAKIKAPTLIVAADKEDIPIEHTVQMFQSISGAQLCIVPGTTHFLMSERPDIVNRVILEFLGIQLESHRF